MELLIITGQSGAGKTKALSTLEDIGYYCVDNVMPSFIIPMTDMAVQMSPDTRVAVVTDTRSGEDFAEFTNVLSALNERKINYKVLFLSANDTVLLNRYSETRRVHPLAIKENCSLLDAIRMEKELLSPAREVADYFIDSSSTSAGQMRERILSLFLPDSRLGMNVEILSFGFKFGFPGELNLLFDTRCLPNPFYIDEYKDKTGDDATVSQYVLSSDDAKQFLENIKQFLKTALPLYQEEGKNNLVIGVGCTGGHHRSVTIANEIYHYVQDMGFRCTLNHRDIRKSLT